MADHLPPSPWTRRDDLATLIAALGGSDRARYVGGAVRDTLLGQPVSDIDLATPLPPDAVMARLAEARIRAVPTGLAHGTVTAVLEGGPVEITTLREDIATDGRHALVAFATDWQADAARRDFTINAMYADPATLAIFDYFGGRADLAARRVRFIGDPATRIAEDHLRILRYFRFCARFGEEVIDRASEDACARFASTLMGLSRERIRAELLKLLALPDPAPTIARMARLGVLRVVLPEADAGPLAHLVDAERAAGIAGDPLRRLAALLPADPAIADAVAARLRLSAHERQRLTVAAGRSADDGDVRNLAYHLGRERVIDRLLLQGRDLAVLGDWEPPAFPLKGGAIVARGIAAGPEVAHIRREVEARWIAEGFPDVPRVDEILTEVLATR